MFQVVALCLLPSQNDSIDDARAVGKGSHCRYVSMEVVLVVAEVLQQHPLILAVVLPDAAFCVVVGIV